MEALEQYLEAQRINRSGFARRIGISAPYLTQIMQRQRTPSLALALKIATVTRGAVPVESWLDHGAPSHAAPRPVTQADGGGAAPAQGADE